MYPFVVYLDDGLSKHNFQHTRLFVCVFSVMGLQTRYPKKEKKRKVSVWAEGRLFTVFVPSLPYEARDGSVGLCRVV